MKYKKSKQKTSNGVNEQVSVANSQFNKLDIEELNKVSAASGVWIMVEEAQDFTM